MFAVLVPFYNEENNLPVLVKSFQNQKDQDFKVVFVDNNSTDNSAQYIKSLIEVKKNKWYYVKEEKKGLWAAIKKGLHYIDKNKLSKFIYRIDSDSFIPSVTWSYDVKRVLRETNRNLGYFYGPFEYTEFEQFSRFKRCYEIYNNELTNLMRSVGWFGTGTNALYSVNTLKKITRLFSKNKLSEEDLKMGLLLRFKKKHSYLIDHKVISSGRNIIKDAQTFAKWCFYNDEFYSNKWTATKSYQPEKTKDLSKNNVAKFFYRRSLKLTTRNIIPLMIYDTKDQVLKNIVQYLELNQDLGKMIKKYRKLNLVEILLNETKYEELIDKIAKEKNTVIIAESLAEKMKMIYHISQSNQTIKNNFYYA